MTGILIKTALALAGAVYLGNSDGILNGIVYFAIIYGLLSYYVWYFKTFQTPLSLMTVPFALGVPVFVLLVFMLILNEIWPDGTGRNIAGVIIIIMCVRSLLRDIVAVVNNIKSGGNVE